MVRGESFVVVGVDLIVVVGVDRELVVGIVLPLVDRVNLVGIGQGSVGLILVGGVDHLVTCCCGVVLVVVSSSGQGGRFSSSYSPSEYSSYSSSE